MDGSDLVFIARTRAGLSQAQLGERAGIAQNAVARIENGRVHTSFETVRDLVRAAGFEPEITLRTGDDSLRTGVRQRMALRPAERIGRAVTDQRTLSRLRGLARGRHSGRAG